MVPKEGVLLQAQSVALSAQGSYQLLPVFAGVGSAGVGWLARKVG